MKSHKARTILITGGTKGIGLAVAQRFAQEGDQCILTYNWGSQDEEQVLQLFNGLLEPFIFQANVKNEQHTLELLEIVKEKYGEIDIFVSNVSFANLVHQIDDYSEKGLFQSIEYSTWPLIAYTKRIKEIIGKYPRYIIGLSSHGPDSYHKNYDFAAVTKSLLEVFVRYLNYHFFKEQVIFNVVRTRPILTDSLISTLGEDWPEFIAKYDVTNSDVSLEDFAKFIYAMCSGFMDGIRGQTINVDNGYQFADGIQSFYEQRRKLGLE